VLLFSITIFIGSNADVTIAAVYIPADQTAYMIKYFPNETLETNSNGETIDPALEPPPETEPETTTEPEPIATLPIETTQPQDPIVTVPKPSQPQDPIVTVPKPSQPPNSIQYVGREPYDYTQPVPLSEPVDKSYFDDAVFIGDSRMYGFCSFNGLVNNYSAVSLATRSVYSNSFLLDANDPEKTYTIIEALKLMKDHFKKVYIALGLNELGNEWGFIRTYESIIDYIKETIPDVIIYIQDVLPVTKARSEDEDSITNDKIYRYNELLLDLAMRKEVFYLDLTEIFVDDNGDFINDRTLVAGDGVHMSSKAARMQLEYFQNHVVDFEKVYLYPWEEPIIYVPPVVETEIQIEEEENFDEIEKEPNATERFALDRDNFVVRDYPPDELQQ